MNLPSLVDQIRQPRLVIRFHASWCGVYKLWPHVTKLKRRPRLAGGLRRRGRGGTHGCQGGLQNQQPALLRRDSRTGPCSKSLPQPEKTGFLNWSNKSPHEQYYASRKLIAPNTIWQGWTSSKPRFTMPWTKSPTTWPSSATNSPTFSGPSASWNKRQRALNPRKPCARSSRTCETSIVDRCIFDAMNWETGVLAVGLLALGVAGIAIKILVKPAASSEAHAPRTTPCEG